MELWFWLSTFETEVAKGSVIFNTVIAIENHFFHQAFVMSA